MNKEASMIFSRVILPERTIRIKLLGDSITHGVGGTGFNQNGEPITANFARNPDGYCWAKRFKETMESEFDCTVINNACTGTNIEFVMEHFDELVDSEDDIMLCTIGTNNRHQYFKDAPKHTKREYMEQFYRNIVKLHSMFQAAGKDVVFMANIPAAPEKKIDGDDFWRIFHMSDVQNLYIKASAACKFPLICMYTLFLEYCATNDIPIETLLADGLHPNDRGYDVIFSLLMKELGIARAIPSNRNEMM